MPIPDTGIARLVRDITAAAEAGDGLRYTAGEAQELVAEIAAEIERNAAAIRAYTAAEVERVTANFERRKDF